MFPIWVQTRDIFTIRMKPIMIETRVRTCGFEWDLFVAFSLYDDSHAQMEKSLTE